MKLIKKIEEGESWTSSIIGYKHMTYRGMNEEDTTHALRIGVYLYFFLIKIEVIQIDQS